MKENNTKLELYKPKRGWIPTIKSAIWGDDSFYNQQQIVNEFPSFFQFFMGKHTFARRNLKCLVNTADNNADVSGVIQKILFAQTNINFIPYKSGKPYKSATFDLDINRALMMLLKTGTCIIWKKEVIGFGKVLDILNTLDVTEIRKGNNFEYRLDKGNGVQLAIPVEQLIFIKIDDIVNEKDSNLGLSPLQIALMPLEALEQMYLADTSTLKNKGADFLVTNDTDEALVSNEGSHFDESFNRRLAGARKAGKAITSTAKLRVLQLGRTTKELALWDGYAIKLRGICNALQVNSSLFNDPANTTYSNQNEAWKAFYNQCVIPYTRKITDNKEVKSALGYEIFLDTSNIDVLQEAQSLRNEKNKVLTDAIINLNQQVKNGVISVEIAIEILVSEWNYDLEEATKLIQVPKQNEVVNEQL